MWAIIGPLYRTRARKYTEALCIIKLEIPPFYFKSTSKIHIKCVAVLSNQPFNVHWLIYELPSLTFKNSACWLHCIYVLRVDLRTNSKFALYIIKRLGFITEAESLLRGTGSHCITPIRCVLMGFKRHDFFNLTVYIIYIISIFIN